ncbi:hypothetical protein F4779DRAFT_616531 [Xylariaceae sp. FL0662B]|nr:hypothetical protein F4779DRAFT_616531 [Xylariaceae sp. FL0662B]
MVWFEDAVANYGVPTVVFDLHLIVPDIDEASAILQESGWERLLSPPTEEDVGSVDDSPPAAIRPDQIPIGRVATVLYSAAEWDITKDTLVEASQNQFYPRLPMLINTLIDSLLDIPLECGLYDQVEVMMAYLYGHVPELQDRAFADQLDPAHRQFHLDRLSKQLSLWTIPFTEHERLVRDEMRKGGYQLRDCSAVRTEDNGILFTDYSF